MQYLAIDTETTGTNFRRGAKPFFVSTCTEDGETKGWRFEVNPRTREVYVPYHYRQEVIAYTKGFIPVFHNAKFDIRALRAIDIDLDVTEYEDTLLASHAVSSTDNHGLKELAIKYLGYTDHDERLLHKAVLSARGKAKKLGWTLGADEKDKEQPAWDYWMPGQLESGNNSMETYAYADAERTILLWLIYKDLLKEQDLWKGYCEEKELLKVVMKVEDCGLTLKKSKVLETASFLSRNRTKYVDKYKFAAKKAFGKVINPDSGDDIRQVIYEDFAIEPIAFTEKGTPKTDKKTLQKLYEGVEENTYEHKFLKELLTSKAYVSGARYLRGYRQLAHSIIPGFITLYTSLNQVGAATNRFTSSNPNGQNVGKKNKYNVADREIIVPKMRDVFCPAPGKVWYSIDYSQIELRVFAAVSDEESLMDALLAGYDFHGYVASRIFDVELHNVTDAQRTIAKNVNFALIFGAKEAKVNATAGMDNAYELFATQFPHAHKFMAKVIQDVERDGYVHTIDGYRLSVPLETPYKGVNYMVQGTAGRIIKKAMRELDKQIDWQEFKMILQVHDELIFEVNEDSEYNSPKYLRNIMDIMEGAGDAFNVVTPVSLEIIREDWGHGVECKTVTESEFVLAG